MVLRQLKLRHNSIGEEGVEALASSVEMNGVLTTLDFDSTVTVHVRTDSAERVEISSVEVGLGRESSTTDDATIDHNTPDDRNDGTIGRGDNNTDGVATSATTNTAHLEGGLEGDEAVSTKVSNQAKHRGLQGGVGAMG